MQWIFGGLVFLCANSWSNMMEDSGVGFVKAPKFCKRVEYRKNACDRLPSKKNTSNLHKIGCSGLAPPHVGLF
jgi:hypothetical protein